VALTRALIQQTGSGVTVSGPEGSRSLAPVIEIPCLCGYVSTAIDVRKLGRRHLAWRGLARPPIASERGKRTTVAGEVDCIPSRAEVWVDLTVDLLPT
jgi:hypothetical protein